MNVNNTEMTATELETLEVSANQLLKALNRLGEKSGTRYTVEQDCAPYGLLIWRGVNDEDGDWRGEFSEVEMIEELAYQLRRLIETKCV